MSMRILAHQQQEGRQPHERIHSMLKHHLIRLEQAGSLSITILQSMILLAVYELGHGIYPAAYFTIGSCARYAVALGLDNDILAWNHSDSGWGAMEEKHRAWWAIVILERSVSELDSNFFHRILIDGRHMNVNNPHRTLCTADPNEKSFLPISDEDWNNGVRTRVSYTSM